MSKEEKKAETKAEEEPEIGQMKRGDYLIHVFIEKARQLKAVEGSCDPIIEVKFMETKKFSSGKDNVGTGIISWNEHLFFEPKNLQVDQIEQAKISIKVLDKGFFKDAVIGCFDFDVSYIYFKKDHAMMHTWIALSNPYGTNVNEVCGYLKISIAVSASGDKQIEIKEDILNQGEDKVMMPPSIRPEYHQIHFRFFRAEKLPSMDTNLLGKGGSIDAYITCSYLDNDLKTDVITAKEGFAVDWNTEFLIPCQLPIMSNRIVMKLYDKDLVNDEIVGSFLFNLSDCMNKEKLNGQYFWKNIYGSPLGVAGAHTELMNSNPDIASNWKGRILMQILSDKTEKPQCAKKIIDKEEVLKAYAYLNEHEYEVIAEVGQGIALPDNEKYTVMIKIADFTIQTDKPVFGEGTYNRWSYRSKQTTYKSPYQVTKDIGSYYVYLMLKDKPVCYYRGSIEDICNNNNPKFRWIEMQNDLSIGKVTDSHKAGLVSIKISVHDKTLNGPISFDQFDAWKKPPPKRLNLFKVRAFVFQCRELPSSDADGQSDCFVEIWDTSPEIQRTVTIEDSNDPIFYQTIELSIEASRIEEMPPFILDIYDEDALSNDFIARSVIPMDEAKYVTDDVVPEPKWHSCKIKSTDPECGKILVSFSIVESDYTFKIPRNYLKLKEYVEYDNFNIDVNMLGLRNLQSCGLLPVKKAFIIFNLKSLVPPDDGRKMDNVRTQPGPSGANPTINTQIKFKIPLPRSPLYCPKLSCTVHDYIFKGLSQPLLGAFTIPIGDIIHQFSEDRKGDLKELEIIVEEIDKKLQNKIAVSSYSIQTNSKYAVESMEGEILEEQKEMKLKQARQSVKVTDGMKEPLLQQIRASQELLQTPKDITSPSNSFQAFKQRLTPTNMSQSRSKQNSIIGGEGNAGFRKTTVKEALLQKQQNQKLASAMKGEILKQQVESDEKAKREFDYERQRQLEEFKSQNQNDSCKNIIMAQYELDKILNVHREIKMPPEAVFIGLGWDQNPETKIKHYRRYYPMELEKVKEIFPVESPFDSYDLKRGQTRGAKNWWPFGAKKEDESGQVSTEQVVGKFKGLIDVYSEEDDIKFHARKKELIDHLKSKLNALSMRQDRKVLIVNLEKKLETMEGRQKFDLSLQNLGVGHLNITKKLTNLDSEDILKKLLMQQTRCVVRVYLIGAFNLSSRDNGSESDPYVVVKVGNKVYNERENYQSDNSSPEFNKYYDFEATFPGAPPMVIEMIDYDDIFGDDQIGSTSIDLEDRFFSPEWMSIKHKPIEFRGLNHPSTSISQGTVKLWVEIHPTAIPASEITLWNIAPKPFEEFEVRLVIFDTIDIKAMDVEGTSDVFCKAFFDQKEESKETDTHYRCSNGKASWNYRVLLKMTHPRKDYTLTLQAFDRDFFKSNDIIGEVQVDLAQAIQDCALTKRPLQVNKTYYNNYLKKDKVEFTYKDESSFYVPLRQINDDGVDKINGKLRIQIDIYPKVSAEANKVGEARQEPNHSPFLTPPMGRISFTLNPFGMLNQLIGPALRRKIYCYCCLAACLALCIMLAPLIIGNLISAGFEKLFGLR